MRARSSSTKPESHSCVDHGPVAVWSCDAAVQAQHRTGRLRVDARAYPCSVAFVAALILPVTVGGGDLLRSPHPWVTLRATSRRSLYALCGCHRPGGAAPFSSVATFEDASAPGLIASTVASHDAPPWQPDNQPGMVCGERRLTDRETAVFTRWVSDGIQQGDVAAMPPMPSFRQDGASGEPDLVLTMPGLPIKCRLMALHVFRISFCRFRCPSAALFAPSSSGQGIRASCIVRFLLDESGDLQTGRCGRGRRLRWHGRSGGRIFRTVTFSVGRPARCRRAKRIRGRSSRCRSRRTMHPSPPDAASRCGGIDRSAFTNTPPSRTPVLLRLGSKTIDIRRRAGL